MKTYSFSCYEGDKLILEIKFDGSLKDLVNDILEIFVETCEPEKHEDSISLSGQHAQPVLHFGDLISPLEELDDHVELMPEVKQEVKVSKCPICSLTTQLLGNSTCYDSHCPMPNRVNSQR